MLIRLKLNGTVNWDSINDYEPDVRSLLNARRMDQKINLKTTSTSTLDLVFVNFPAINIERDLKFDDSYSLNGKRASNPCSLSVEIPWNYQGRKTIPNVHSSFYPTNFDLRKTTCQCSLLMVTAGPIPMFCSNNGINGYTLF